MSKIFFTLIFALVCFSASAQNPSTGKASITPKMVETLVKMNKATLKLTSSQTLGVSLRNFAML